jgi:stage V sporulation protein AE
MADLSIMNYLTAFLCGGILCVIGQILIDKTNLTPARILVIYVVTGVILGSLGIYRYIADWGGAGASVPLTGFGYALSKGVTEAIQKTGFMGVFTGGVIATAGGISAAVFFGFLVALIFKPKSKN